MSASMHQACMPINYPERESCLFVQCEGVRRQVRLLPSGRVDVQPAHDPAELALRVLAGRSGPCVCQQRREQIKRAVANRDKLPKAIKKMSRAIWWHRTRLDHERKVGRGWRRPAPLQRAERLPYLLRQAGGAR
jgi:hypothetical protein